MVCLIVSFIILSQGNMGIKCCCRCLDKLLTCIFILLRIAAICIYFFYLLPILFYIIYLSVAMNFTNQWKSDDEPWRTSASWFNSTVSWILTVTILWYCFFLFFYIMIGVCVCVSLIIDGSFSESCGNCYSRCCPYFRKFSMWIITGHAYDFYMTDPFSKRVVIDDSNEAQEKRDKFFKKQQVGFGRLLLNEEFDCPICAG